MFVPASTINNKNPNNGIVDARNNAKKNAQQVPTKKEEIPKDQQTNVGNENGNNTKSKSETAIKKDAGISTGNVNIDRMKRKGAPINLSTLHLQPEPNKINVKKIPENLNNKNQMLKEGSGSVEDAVALATGETETENNAKKDEAKNYLDGLNEENNSNRNKPELITEPPPSPRDGAKGLVAKDFNDLFNDIMEGDEGDEGDEEMMKQNLDQQAIEIMQSALSKHKIDLNDEDTQRLISGSADGTISVTYPIKRSIIIGLKDLITIGLAALSTLIATTGVGVIATIAFWIIETSFTIWFNYYVFRKSIQYAQNTIPQIENIPKLKKFFRNKIILWGWAKIIEYIPYLDQIIPTELILAFVDYVYFKKIANSINNAMSEIESLCKENNFSVKNLF